MPVSIQEVGYAGWKRNVRLSDGKVDLILTTDIGPRIIRLGFMGAPNLFAELEGQMGGANEKEWLIRGGHRLWVAPEEKPKTYELDNGPIQVRRIRDGVRTIQPPGPLSGIQKTMAVRLIAGRNEIRVTHILTNCGRKRVRLAVWAFTAMAKNGMAVIPLPAKIPHTERLTHNQEWSLWGYTDFSDPRWTLGSRYLFLRQDPKRGPTKLGIAHREGWTAYVLKAGVFVKKFVRLEGKEYPDGGVNFETFTNEDFLEMESIGPLVSLAPGQSARHSETWQIFKRVPPIRSEADADRRVARQIGK